MDAVHCVLQIQAACADGAFGTALPLLAHLDEVSLTAEQLETTEAAPVLYRLLKTCPNDGVRRAAKALLSRWKKQYGGDRGRRAGTNAEPPSASVREDAAASGDKPDLQAVPEASEGSAPSCGLSPVRSKCVQLLLTSLCPRPPDEARAAELAGAIEQHIHERHKTNLLRYKACVRSKVANLRNPKTQHLRQGLLDATLPPLTFALMTAEEMAGAELRRLREAYSSRGVSERQLPRGVEGTPTDRIRCKRCGGRGCRVSQVTRGALFLPSWVRRGGPGEDSMTFVTCGGCGEQWYHGNWVCL